MKKILAFILGMTLSFLASAQVQQKLPPSTLVGNSSGSTAGPGAITLGTNLSFAGSVLNATGGGSSAFNSVTGGTNTTAAMVVGSGATLGTTGTGAINFNCTNGTSVLTGLQSNCTFLT